MGEVLIFMVDQDKLIKFLDNRNVLDLLNESHYDYYYPESRCDVFMKRLDSKNFVALNCKDSIYDGMDFEELVIRYKFTFERFISETDEGMVDVLENELKIIKKYMYECLDREKKVVCLDD